MSTREQIIDVEPEQELVSTKQKSVADFDRSGVLLLEDKKVSELDSGELLKVLVRRGEDTLNPAQSKGALRLLQQLHGEVLRKHPSSYRGRRYNRGRNTKHVSNQEDEV